MPHLDRACLACRFGEQNTYNLETLRDLATFFFYVLLCTVVFWLFAKAQCFPYHGLLDNVIVIWLHTWPAKHTTVQQVLACSALLNLEFLCPQLCHFRLLSL